MVDLCGSERLHPDREPPAQALRWWVGFSDDRASGFHHWWDIFTRPGFRHCYAFAELAPGVLLVVNPLIHCVHIQSIASRPWRWIEREQDEGGLIVTIEVDPDPCKPPRRGPVMTCASLVAYTMGLDTRAVTPYGLFRSILASGGEILQRRR